MCVCVCFSPEASIATNLWAKLEGGRKQIGKKAKQEKICQLDLSQISSYLSLSLSEPARAIKLVYSLKAKQLAIARLKERP